MRGSWRFPAAQTPLGRIGRLAEQPGRLLFLSLLFSSPRSASGRILLGDDYPGRSTTILAG